MGHVLLIFSALVPTVGMDASERLDAKFENRRLFVSVEVFGDI